MQTPLVFSVQLYAKKGSIFKEKLTENGKKVPIEKSQNLLGLDWLNKTVLIGVHQIDLVVAMLRQKLQFRKKSVSLAMTVSCAEVYDALP